jgi:hypothetical protein
MTESCRKRFLRQKRNAGVPFLLTIIATVGMQCVMHGERRVEREREREKRERTANGPKQWLVESRL